jgi:uncharacterized metal-binding protein
MSDKKTHQKQSLAIIVFIAIACFITASLYNNLGLLLIPVGMTINIYILHSDLDQCRKGYFKLYGLLPHRSPWSHWPILATMIRDMYVLPFAILAWHFLTSEQIMYLFAGQCVADGLHLVFDLESTNVKRMR